MKCDQWRQMVNSSVPNCTSRLHTTAEMTRLVTLLGMVCQVDVEIQGDAVIRLTRMPAPRTPKRHKNDRKVGFRPHHVQTLQVVPLNVAILRSACPWLKPAYHVRLFAVSTQVLFKQKEPLNVLMLPERVAWGVCLGATRVRLRKMPLERR